MKVQKRKLMLHIPCPPAFSCLISGNHAVFYAYGQWRKRYYGKQCGEPGQLPSENREVMLENAMVEQWSSIRKESTYLNLEMSESSGKMLWI